MTNSSDSSHAGSGNTSRTTAKKSSRGSEPDEEAPPRRTERLRPAEAIREAREQLGELTGKPVDAVSTFSATEDGWNLEVEVLELSRVPDTMSLLASYRVTLDHQGMLTGYQRIRRYERGRSDDRRSG
ncbi:gas vesicle protein [Streptomyces tropicalis]|uniref:Gas vesicle protein n=1 Tax=Streptomyces tropicalis TaxID=3034234 RepID=A0ABT6A4G8_9ACTN|nr:gas vesicle protein [Streptomyces tropicalis]MDF3299543.1 gas vesicle protein [Streptomyces tropicalis]